MDEIEAKFSDPQSELDHMLSEMQQGYRIQIKRVEPEWCNGILGTFEFDTTEPISTQWIVNRFGGRKLQCKILNSKGDYVGARTVVFPDTPKKDGAEIVPGPHGSPILAARAEQPQPAQDNAMVGVLEKILAMQTAQANTMQTMLLSRVQSLEGMLTQKIDTPAVAAPPNPYDPNIQLRTTIETMKMIDELKDNVRTDEQDEEDPQNPYITKILDRFLEKFVDETPAQGSPPIPKRTEPTNKELINLVKSRMAGMDPLEKEFLVSQVLEGDDEDDIQEDAGQENQQSLESLLTPEDEETLNEPANPPSNVSTSDSRG